MSVQKLKHAKPPPARSRLWVWLLASLVLVLGVLVYGMIRPSTPDAFDRPEAQTPNRLRSPWGVANPL